MWLIKYVSPALVTACSQPSGSVPNCPSAFEDIIGFEAAVAERVTRLIPYALIKTFVQLY